MRQTLVLGALLLGFCIGLFANDSRVGALGLALSGVAWWCASAARRELAPGKTCFWAIALGMRLLALSAGPQYSDDVYRYLWEGEVVDAGKSPYAYAPDAPELADLRARLPELAARVNHRDVPAAYPPLMQACGAWVAGVVRLAGLAPLPFGVFLLRALFLAADLAVLCLIVRAEKHGELGSGAHIVWGWCPLVCLEFAGSGHFDSLGILFLVAALLAWERRGLASSIFCGLGSALKFVPLCLVPWSWRDRSRREAVAFTALALGCLLAGYLPFLALEGGGRGFTAGLREYGERWESASLVYQWVEPCIRAFDAAGDPRHLTRVLFGLLWLGYAVWTFLRVRDPWSGCARLIGAFLVLSPTLHPWYLLWMLPFLARRPNAGWFWLLACAGLLYWPRTQARASGVWDQPAWMWWVVAPCFFGLLLFEFLSAARRTEASPA